MSYDPLFIYRAEMDLGATYYNHSRLMVARECFSVALAAARALGREDLIQSANDALATAGGPL